MSGGVDSSVAACLLKEQGYDITGLFMRVGAEISETDGPSPASGQARQRQGCCSASDAADARYVAGLLNVPFYVLNFKDDFDELMDYFADEYAVGRTPNPCVVCNQRFKFGKILDYADAIGATCVATGHYARIDRSGGAPSLRRALDAQKDQTYVLFGLRRELLDRVLFPLGDLTKDAVRDEARRRGLPNCDKPDSVEICFVPDQDYAGVVKRRRPDAFREGDVVDQQGRTVARHAGVANFTIGQRRGLGIAAGTPIYVTRLDATTNTVTVGSKPDLLNDRLWADGVNLLETPTSQIFRAEVKIRYLHRAAPASVTILPGGFARVDFDEPQSAITPGQAVVFYDRDVVIGGGWIRSPGDESLEKDQQEHPEQECTA